MWNRIERKVLGDERLSPEEGRFLLSETCDLLALGSLAQRQRFRKNPEAVVTFLIDSNPNYTNICETDCLFCAFSRRRQHAEAYALSVAQVMEKVQKAVDLGATTVLLQGGHNPSLPLDYYLELVRETRRRFPHVTPHYFSASEIQTMSSVSGRTLEEVLKALWQAGQKTLPGGGAEILSEQARKKISPKKGGPEKWLEVHRTAHLLGYRSTATMMYGHVETANDVVEHWEHIRSLQDETKGFTAFVPWSFKPSNTLLERRYPSRMGSVSYLRLLAASRLYLDNFPHVQASWFSEGKKAGQVALYFGADDFGGTLIDENVHAAADFVNKANTDEVVTLIREAGFVPAQRTTLYVIIKTHPVPGCPTPSSRGQKGIELHGSNGKE